EMDADDDPLLQNIWLDEEDDDITINSQRVSRGHNICKNCLCRTKCLNCSFQINTFWAIIGWILTNTYCAILILIIGCVIPAVLAVIMFVHYPPLDIDISYNAFEIRNHEASQRFDALTLALKSQFGTWGRNRRDLADFTSETLQKLIFEQLQQLHENTSQSVQSLKFKSHYTKSLSNHGTWPGKASLVKRSVENFTASEMLCEHRTRQTRAAPLKLYQKAYINADTQTHAHWKMELVFLARGDDENNIFTKERLFMIHDIEKKIMNHPGFREFCWKPHEVLKDLPLGSYSYCSPPSSLMTYFFPTKRGGKIYYDGMGEDLADIRGSLQLAITHPEFYWYVDEGLTVDNMKSSLLRSEILFGAPLPNYYSVDDRWDEQHKKFQTFIVTYVAMLAQQSTSKVQVLYGGTDLFDYEVRRTFYNDMLLAFISSGCIAVLVYTLTSFSVFLSFFGIASIGLSCLVALFLYHVVFGVQYLGILNGVAAFVVVGIGVDDVFVFINTFRQAGHLKDLQHQMIHTIQTAGKATFFTSFTTAAAYAANVFSQIPAVHDFGLFMSLIVACCWVAVLFIMPAALCIWSLYISPLESTCQSSCHHKCLKKSNSMKIEEFDDSLLNLEQNSLPGHETMQYLDDDIPLLSVEEEYASYETGDVPLISLLPESILLKYEKCRPGHMITQLQDSLYHWVAWPVVEGRWIILGLYVAVLIVSVIFAIQLQPASRAPLLFKPDTNIQVLLDLKYNLSAEGLSCVTCSGLFQEKPHSLQSNIRTSSEKKKRGQSRPWNNKPASKVDATSGTHATVYVSKCENKVRPTIYRFSLNASVPSPWQLPSPANEEVSSFQVYRVPFGNFTKKLTICMSRVGPVGYNCPKKWMITSFSCDARRGWKFDFSFYVAKTEQYQTRKLYFAQLRKYPFHSRVCLAPPGCAISVGPDGPSQGFFFVPYEKATHKEKPATARFNPCLNNSCGKPAVRPLTDTGAMVFVVFGIKGVNRTRSPDNHVIGDMGSVIYDETFDLFKELGNLCKICKVIANNIKLVKTGGAQCLPSGYSISSFLQMLHPECKDIPEPNLLPGQLSHGVVGLKEGKIQWISMAFESTTYKGKSSFQTYSDYLKWESFLQEQLHLLPETSSLRHGFQTCEHWKQIFMEIIGVQSALYGLILSLVICVGAVAVFTTHIFLLLPVVLTILGVIFLVVAIMYWSGWEMGAVEAISLSILVGSSVDYCVHLVEGYLLAGDNLSVDQLTDKSTLRKQRTLGAIKHVGVAIVSSALTTVIATIPLFFCIIAPFAKFGKIVALNTGISILYTLTVSTALLSLVGPCTFSRTRTSFLKASLGVFVTGVVGLSICLVLIKCGIQIPLPNGATL
uniref:Dispatched RND transporter family member 3 n=2 Tax=Latimeria chalumnae TaxID=7897 RepID=H3AV32_LATCH